MGISVGGIASGLDTEGIIGQLLALEQRPIQALQRKIAIAEQKRVAYSDLDGRLSSLRNAVRAVGDTKLFGSLSTSSSDPSLVTATASASASPGSYAVRVLQTAAAHRVAAQGFVDDRTTAVAAAAGTFGFTVNGQAHSFAVDATTTLKGLADQINGSGSGVTAQIVNDGSSANAYRLVLTSGSEGLAGRVVITDNDTTLDFTNKRIDDAEANTNNAADYTGAVTSSGTYTGTANTAFVVEIMTEGPADGTARFRYSADGGLTFNDNGGLGFAAAAGGPILLADGVEVNFTDDGTDLRVGDSFRIDVFNPELQAARNAVVNINGLNVTKPTNTITDTFEGLTLNLLNADPGRTVTVSVSRQTGDVNAALSGFMGAYNSVIGYLNAQFSYDPQSGEPEPPLNGDSAARQVQRELRRIVTGRLPGLAGDTLSSLAELGFSSNSTNGLLSINTAKVEELMRTDPTAVERVLSRFGERLSGDFSYLRRTSNTEPGTYSVEVTQARTRAQTVGAQAAEALAGNESVTIEFFRNMALENPVPVVTQVNLLAGDTVAVQIQKLQQALTDANVGATVYLDGDGKIGVRADNYGAVHRVRLVSNLAAGAGTTGIGDAQIDHQGTDLAGTIGGRPAYVLDGNNLKGTRGYETADLEVVIPNDVSGVLGKVRITNGLAESMPGAIDGLTSGRGILRARTDGIADSITRFEEQIVKTQRRTAMTEARLRRQFTNLEVQLGKLNALGDYVSQQMQAMQSQSNASRRR